MAIYALPRATLGIDIMIELDTLFRTKRAVEGLGFTLSGAPMEFHGGKVQIYRLCKIDAVSTEELERKFTALVGSRFGAPTADAMLVALHSIEQCSDMATLFKELGNVGTERQSLLSSSIP